MFLVSFVLKHLHPPTLFDATLRWSIKCSVLNRQFIFIYSYLPFAKSEDGYFLTKRHTELWVVII